MSYDLEEKNPLEPKSTRKSAQPMPRLWKAEPEPTEEESPSAKKSRKDGETEPSKKSSDSKASTAKGKTKSAKGKGPSAADEKAEKKVLIEDTPTLDTYESRRRARLIMGALSVACVLLFGWIIYRVFLYDPVGTRRDQLRGTRQRASPGPESAPRSTRKPASCSTGRRIRQERPDRPGRGHVESAWSRSTRERPPPGSPRRHSIVPARTCRCSAIVPLSSPRPKQPKPAPSPAPPPAVVDASPAQPQAAQGQVALVLPANPAEVVVVPPPTSAARTGTTAAAIASRPLPQGFQANLDAGIHESGWPLVIVGDRDGAPMVLVPGGTFSMGSNEGQPAEAPAHQVRLSTYYIDQHEVTNRQFRIFLRESHYHGQPAGKWLTDDKARAEPRTRRSFMSTSMTPRRSRPGPASNSRPRRNGKWQRGRPMAGGIPGATRRPSGPGPERSARSIRS